MSWTHNLGPLVETYPLEFADGNAWVVSVYQTPLVYCGRRAVVRAASGRIMWDSGDCLEGSLAYTLLRQWEEDLGTVVRLKGHLRDLILPELLPEGGTPRQAVA